MNAPNEKLQFAAKLIDEDFDLHDTDKISIQIFPDLDALKLKLIVLIKYCLQKDFNHLVNVMYRIDVKETEFKKAMAGPDIEAIASDIADLVIQREMQKVETRLKYKE